MSFLTGYLFIFLARVSDVTLATIRMLMVVQGRKIQAAIIGFFEVSIYVTALSKVVSNLDNPINLFAYAFGFACGNLLGVTIENKIALGKLSTQVILKGANGDNEKLIMDLREKGFGVTTLEGYGREGSREILQIVINRKDLNRLKEIVYSYDRDAFIMANTISPVSGGYFSSIKKK
ncbi:DUF2179 domain-containing protein [Tepidimicrobium xylanilyticum]|uniref:UPF0316 protein SAMN05660923_02853 n=1 Tax=Tepidimicrobium xylanilyticum TaxID=1123352 RepID=A0A1H3E7T3_9FIRM|nr:DUF5698 domain-containing protein [Tepidimicrobium xylanilyticum]GMG95831.1 UPF0316 protein [Tepidimicrobium xylanilyticum]SDX74715.1 Uncharacterized protein YebE, UPF0316 family [Tepidimicrobium xylanilyticum]